MRYETWQEFFKDCGDDSIELRNYGSGEQVTPEDLYQHFKARMMAELSLVAQNEFDPQLPQYLWSDRRRKYEGAKQGGQPAMMAQRSEKWTKS